MKNKQTVQRKFAIRSNVDDFSAWETAASAEGHASVESWIAETLRKKAVDTRGSHTAGTRLTQLENGIRVVTDEIPGVSQVAIGVLVECGSRDEAADERGLAHLCEHLLFQGTSLRDSMQIARHIDYAGGRVGGFTTRDYTCYHASVLGDYCYHALDLLGDMLLNFTLPQDSVEREKQSILSEIRDQRDVPGLYLDNYVKQHAWAGHNLGWPVAGTEESVLGYSREDVIYFLHRNYTPDRIIIAAAGDLIHKDFVAQTHDAFWRFLGASSPQPGDPAGFQQGFSMLDLACAQSYFCLAFPAPAYIDDQRYAMHILNWILGGGISSRLFRRLREEHGWVYQVSSDYQAYRDGGMVSVEGSTSPDLLMDVIPAALKCLSDLTSWREPVSAEELNRAKTAIRAQHLISSEDVHTRMCRAAMQQFYFGHTIPASEIAAGIERVSVPDLRALLRAMASDSLPKGNLAIGGPPSGWKDSALMEEVTDRFLRKNTKSRPEPCVRIRGEAKASLRERVG